MNLDIDTLYVKTGKHSKPSPYLVASYLKKTLKQNFIFSLEIQQQIWLVWQRREDFLTLFPDLTELIIAVDDTRLVDVDYFRGATKSALNRQF
jgi:hypothetical protein